MDQYDGTEHSSKATIGSMGLGTSVFAVGPKLFALLTLWACDILVIGDPVPERRQRWAPGRFGVCHGGSTFNIDARS